MSAAAGFTGECVFLDDEESPDEMLGHVSLGGGVPPERSVAMMFATAQRVGKPRK
jgi:hypothetical protein